MNRIGIFLFSAYFWVVTFVWMAFLSAFILIFSVLFTYKRIHRWVSAPGLKACIYLGFNRIKVRYSPQFDKNRPSVFCYNHVNFLDAHVAAASIPGPFCGLMHAWQFKIPFYGWIMSLSKGIKVFPERRNNLRLMTEEAKLRNEWGYSILVFPEGGRTLDGKVADFKKGVFLMARDAGYPIVPVAVRGSYAINRKGTRLFHPFKVIEVFIGQQIETKDLSNESISELAKSTKQHMAQIVEAI